MIKKTLIVVAGLALVLALLFGRNGWSYLTTVYADVQQTVEDNIPIETKLKRAHAEIDRLDPAIRDAMHVIAKEEAAVEKLADSVKTMDANLAKSQSEVMILKEHLDGGRGTFVTHGRSFTEKEVENDLTRRFKNFKTMKETADQSREILGERQARLDAARDMLAEMQNAKKDLEIKVENLVTRHRMNEVKQAQSNLNIDDSQLSRTRKFIDDLETQVRVEEKMLNTQPHYSNEIPLDKPEAEGNITQEIDAYFNPQAGSVAGK